MGKRHHPGYVLTALSVLGLFLSACGNIPSTLDPHSPDAAHVANLWWGMFGIAVVVFAVVLGLIIAVIIRSRRSETLTVNPANDHKALPLILLGGVVAPVVVLMIVMGFSVVIDNSETVYANTDKYTIEVIGHQWWWEVRYPNNQVVTANEIHIPVGTRVLMKVTTADVIHSFWVPQLVPKMDTIPGQTNTFYMQADAPGNYRGECAEYCGLQHANMAFIVVAQSMADYNAWIADQQKPAGAVNSSDTAVFQGQQAFLGSACVYCHTVRGTNASGTIGPDLTHIASRQTIAAGMLPNTRGNLGGWIVNSQAIKPGNHMPPMYLDPQQVQQILTYLETLR